MESLGGFVKEFGLNPEGYRDAEKGLGGFTLEYGL